jgi:hypothetical protein
MSCHKNLFSSCEVASHPPTASPANVHESPANSIRRSLALPPSLPFLPIPPLSLSVSLSPSPPLPPSSPQSLILLPRLHPDSGRPRSVVHACSDSACGEHRVDCAPAAEERLLPHHIRPSFVVRTPRPTCPRHPAGGAIQSRTNEATWVVSSFCQMAQHTGDGSTHKG